MSGVAPIKPYTNYSVKARNVSDAVRLFEIKQPHKALFKTATVIILGEDLARKSVVPPLDFFTRKPALRRSVWVMVAEGRAEDILLKGDPGPENIPANNIKSAFQRRQDVTLTSSVNFGQLLSILERPGVDPFMPEIKLAPKLSGGTAGQGETSMQEQQKDSKEGEKQVVEIVDFGVLKSGKLVSFLDITESRGLLWLQGKTQSGTITVPAQGTSWASLLVSSKRVKITPVITQDGFLFNIEIRIEGYVSSVQNEAIDLTKSEDVRLLEEEGEKTVRQDVMAAVKKSQEVHSDFLGFGEKIYETDPDFWKEIGETWRDEWLPNVQVDISVNCRLKRSGLAAEPVKPIP
jgi:spore germination protein KC